MWISAYLHKYVHFGTSNQFVIRTAWQRCKILTLLVGLLLLFKHPADVLTITLVWGFAKYQKRKWMWAHKNYNTEAYNYVKIYIWFNYTAQIRAVERTPTICSESKTRHLYLFFVCCCVCCLIALLAPFTTTTNNMITTTSTE